MLIEYFKTAIDWYMSNINYFTVTLFMTMESTVIPFPSEIIVPPAAWKAAQGGMNIFIIAFCGTLGSLIGASINYIAARTLGRKVIYSFVDTRLAHFMLVNRHNMEKSENFFRKYGKTSTFIGRLVPGVRHLISIPAGIVKMNYRDFAIYTVLGSAIWNIILAAMGYFLYSQQELLHRYFKEISYVLLGLGVVFGLYLLYNGMKKDKPAKPE